MTPGLLQAQSRFHRWMFDAALPVWCTAGRDAPGLGFHEHMTLAGVPAEAPFKRMRVQARQIYVFSHACLLGFAGGMDAAADAHRFITTHGAGADGAWVRTLGRHGGVLDPAADLYDIATILFALAWFARASGERLALDQARRSVGWLRATLRASGGGYHNVWPPEPGHRQQNPHMHLLEAALALYQADPDPLFAELARDLVALFHSRFHHRDSGSLAEFYDDALNPAAGEAGTHVEPGHLYEWVWLLDQHARLLGNRADAEIEGLYRFAETHGRGPGSPGVLDVVGRDGAVRKASSRLWPQAEALKAHVTMLRRGGAAEGTIEAGICHLLDQHLSLCPPGMWREHFDAVGGVNMADKIPASSFYHIFMAYAELQALVTGGQAGSALRPGTGQASCG